MPPLTKPTTSNLKAFKVNFKGSHVQQYDWQMWVERMHEKHHQTWIKAGIEKSIISSIYYFVKKNESIYEVADKWCEKTNTFIFPWGESTITLEDMLVLGGFSLSGHSVLTTLDDVVDDDILLSLNDDLLKYWSIVRGRRRVNISHGLWLKYFMATENEHEHEAFLVLWLSRFVFPVHYIGKKVFPIALRLSKGCRLALGPAVLASIYKGLRLLKEMILFNEIDAKDNSLAPFHLWAPFQYVQLWIWERFPTLSPSPNLLKPGEPRAARWDNIERSKLADVRTAMKDAAVNFQWRPYAATLRNWQPPTQFYREECCLKKKKIAYVRKKSTKGVSNVGGGSSGEKKIDGNGIGDISTAALIQGPSLTVEYGLHINAVSMMKNTEKDMMPESASETMDYSMEDRNLSNFQDFAGETREDGVDENTTPMMEITKMIPQPESVTVQREKSMEDKNPSNVESFVGETQENGDDEIMMTMVEKPEMIVRPEIPKDQMEKSVEDGNPNSVQSFAGETREDGVDINRAPMMKNTGKDIPSEPASETIDMKDGNSSGLQSVENETREDGVDENMTPMMENTEMILQPEFVRDQRGKGIEDGNPSNVQIFVGETREYGFVEIMMPMVENPKKIVQREIAKDHMEKSVEDGNPSNVQSSAGETRERGVDMNLRLMVNDTKINMQPETGRGDMENNTENRTPSDLQSVAGEPLRAQQHVGLMDLYDPELEARISRLEKFFVVLREDGA
ncbi:hypothetical protein ACFE04_022390 [Oxalis oulophora]